MTSENGWFDKNFPPDIVYVNLDLTTELLRRKKEKGKRIYEFT